MGLFDRQKLFRGEKLTDAYAEKEHFILYDLALVVEDSTDLIEGSTVDKAELITGREGEDPILTSTLGNAIVKLARQNVRDDKGKSTADDLPCICYWEKVETKNSFDNEATVLQMVEPYTGKVPTKLPSFSFEPITVETIPDFLS